MGTRTKCHSIRWNFMKLLESLTSSSAMPMFMLFPYLGVYQNTKTIYRIVKLPSDVSKATVYHSYVTASETLQTDITCPQPESNSETDQLAAIVEESNSPPTKRARLCSHCRRPGHSSWKDHVSCTFVMISSLHCNYLVCIIVFLVLFWKFLL